MLKQFVASMVVAAVASGALVAQTTDSIGPRVRVTSAKTQITGRLITIDAGWLIVRSDAADHPVIHVPLSSVSEAAVSAGKRSRTIIVLAATGAAVGATIFGFLLGLTYCGKALFFCSDEAERNARRIGVVAGAAVGVAVAERLRSERWRSIPVASLRDLVTPAEP